MRDTRYSRISRFAGLADSLARWQDASCAVIGLGGLGGGLVLTLARLGVRQLVLVDRDLCGPENLGHQALITELHAQQAYPKVMAGLEAVAAINSRVTVEPHVDELSRTNIAELLASAEIIFDATDNFYTRFLLNDYAHQANLPFIYAGVIRGEATVRAIVPGVTGCLRCLLDAPPNPGDVPVCAEEGVYPPLLAIANGLQLDLANRFFAGRFTDRDDILYSINSADWRLAQLRLRRHADCPCCAGGQYEYLDGTMDDLAAQTCSGRVLEIQFKAELDLDQLEDRFTREQRFRLTRNQFCLMLEEEEKRYVLFPSGKIMLSGSQDPIELNRFAATYLGM